MQAAVTDGAVVEPRYRPSGGGEGTPLLDLDGFSGPLERLLTLARAHEIDLARLSLVALVDQLAAALHAAPAAPLSHKGNWVVMTAWLVELRSRLPLPADPATQQNAEAEAIELRGRLVGLQAMQALAQWLEDRAQLGRDVFARGQPERVGLSVETDHEADVVEFLWASLALFDDASDGPETAAIDRPRWFELYPLAETRARILRLLAASPGTAFGATAAGGGRDRWCRYRAGAATARRLVEHPHRQPGTGETRRPHVGAGETRHPHPRQPRAGLATRLNRTGSVPATGLPAALQSRRCPH